MKKIIFTLLFCLLFSLSALHSARAATTDKAVQALQKNDFKTALDELLPLTQKGDKDAQFLMGMMYDAGKGVPQNPSTAAAWYRKAALQGHPIAQLYLGIMYYSGQGVRKDTQEAARWLRPVADQGNDQAQFYLGWMYAEGNGVAKDEAKAIDLLTKASMQKNTRAMGMLSALLFSRFTQKPKEKKDEKDLIDAYVWSHLAADYDPIQFSTTTRYAIEKYCTEEQANRAKKAMEAWKSKWGG
jgi:uncharacterized protein